MIEETEFGWLLAVTEEPLGDELIEDAPVGSTSLTVDDAADFNEGGGRLRLVTADGTSEDLSYTECDDETGVITLATETTLAAEEGDQVLALFGSTPAVERYAHVALEGEDYNDDAAEALIPQELASMKVLQPGVLYSDDGPAVEVGYVGDELYLVRVHLTQPEVDGSSIDPATIPERGSDGLPPAISPTPEVIGVPKLLIVKWAGIENHDPVEYELHVSTTQGFTPDETTLLTTTAAVMEAIENLPDGSPLEYGTEEEPVVYYVRLVAYDEDGAAAASEEASGSLNPNGTADIAVGAITAAHLDAVMAVISRLATAESGRRVNVSNEGLIVYAQDETKLVHFSTDPDSPMYFNGSVVASTLTAMGVTISGEASMETGSVMTLESGLEAPMQPPSVEVSYPTRTITDDPNPAGKRGFVWDTDTTWGGSAGWVYLQRNADDNSWYAKKVSDLGDTLAETTALAYADDAAGIVKVSSNWYVMYYWAQGWHVDRFASDWTYQSTWTYNSAFEMTYRPAFGYDPVNGQLMIAYSTTSKTWRIEFRTLTGGVGASPVVSNNTPGNAPLAGVLRPGTAAGLPGTSTFLIVPRNPNGNQPEIQAFGGDGAYLPNWSFPLARGATVCGFGFDGENLHHLSEGSGPASPGHIVEYPTGNNFSTESSTWRAYFTWFDPTNGYETAISPHATFTMKRRARVVVTTPPIPENGGATAVRVYLHRGSSAPSGVSNIWRNASPAEGATTARIDSAVFSGTSALNPPSETNFPDSIPAKIQTKGGATYIRGNGEVRIGANGRVFKAIDFGEATASVSGGSGDTYIPHNLGVKPTLVVANLTLAGGSIWQIRRVPASDETNVFRIRVLDQTGSFVPDGTAVTVQYIAIAT